MLSRNGPLLSHQAHWLLWHGWSQGQILYAQEPDMKYLQCAFQMNCNSCGGMIQDLMVLGGRLGVSGQSI